MRLIANGEKLPVGKSPTEPVSALSLEGLTAGDYLLTIPGERSIQVRVTAGQAVQNWLLSPNRELEVRNAAPLNIARVQREAGALVVQLANAGSFARVHVVATRFLPETNLFGGLGGFISFDPAFGAPAKLPNLFAAGRAIGDEYRYILERRYAKVFPGNMLPRPGLILNPWEVRSTDLQSQSMEAMQRPAATAGGHGAVPGKAPERQRKPRHLRRSWRKRAAISSFSPRRRRRSYNLVPDEKGQVRVDLKALGDRQYVQVYAEDLRGAVWRTVALPEVPTRFQDLRLVRNLDPANAVFRKERDHGFECRPDAQSARHSYRRTRSICDSVAKVFSLLTTLSTAPKPSPGSDIPGTPPDASGAKENLAKFAWIIQWPKLSEEDKRAKYSEFACHELNFFLAHKDPAFFQKVVQPYLRNKKDRTFMDDFLLGNDLHGYLEPWAFGRLNAAERCLLAQHLPGEMAAMARHERELWELIPPDAQREDLLFETALRGRALTEGELGEFGAEKAKQEETADALAAPGITARGGAAVASVAGVFTDPQFAAAAKKGPGEKVNLPMAKFSSGVEAASGALMPMTPAAAPHPLAPASPLAEPALRQQVTKDGSGQWAYIEQNNLKELNFDELKVEREHVRQFFRALGPTKEWAENNYYKLPLAAQNADLIAINAFWRDYAAWDGKSPFLSTNIAEAGRWFPEIMLALAVLDLPFDSPKHTTRSENGQFTLTAAGPMIAFTSKSSRAAPAPDQSPLLVSQNFFRADDRFREGRQRERSTSM